MATAGFVLALMELGCASPSSAITEPTPMHMSARLVALSSVALPAGTILPVKLERTVSVEDAQAGQEIEARVMQDVPLADHGKSQMNSRVTGTIVSVVKAADGTSIDVSLRFEKIENHMEMISIASSLRAIASFESVRAAQTPLTGADPGSPSGWADTVQIGGDIRYGDSGKVRNRQKQVVGHGVIGGVLVHARAQSGSRCEGPVNGDDRLQALWVFSADACGVYGMDGVQIIQTGKTNPVGVVMLRFEKANMKFEAGIGMLLRVVAPR
jgi:hypothetical protein